MANTIPGIALQQNVDANGTPLSGCTLYIFEAGTTDPVIAYSDVDLTTEHEYPIEGDANGRVPWFWLPDGIYRVRLTDSSGVVQYDVDDIAVVTPTPADEDDDDEDTGTIDPSQLLSTGMVIWQPSSERITGWVRCNGLTIGNAASGATERPGPDTQDLFEWLFNHLDDTVCPVSGGRGASAALDFATAKQIQLPDMRGRTTFGLDAMGNSLAGVITAATFSGTNTPGTPGGAENHTIVTGEVPIMATGGPTPTHHHTVPWATSNLLLTTGATSIAIAIAGGPTDTSDDTPIHGHTVGTDPNTAMDTISPGMLGTFYIKL